METPYYQKANLGAGIVLPIIILGMSGGGLLGILVWKIFLAGKKRFAAAIPFEYWDCDTLGKVMIAKISNTERVRHRRVSANHN